MYGRAQRKAVCLFKTEALSVLNEMGVLNEEHSKEGI